MNENGLGVSRIVILRAIGLIYITAFTSLFIQLPGLYGSDGLKPVDQYLASLRGSFEEKIISTPTIFHFSEIMGIERVDLLMDYCCVVGALLGVLQSLGFCWNICYLIQWTLYLSFVKVGSPFLWFQWDILLLEVGFVIIFLAPVSPWKRLKIWGEVEESEASCMMWVLRFILVKLMFLSGVVKLNAPNTHHWNDLTAMNYHFATQCIPTSLSYYLHQFPQIVHQLEVLGTLIIEIPLTLILLAPFKQIRQLAALIQIFLQLVIIASGNYCFFNLLTIILCLSFLHNRFWSLTKWTKWWIYALSILAVFLVVEFSVSWMIKSVKIDPTSLHDIQNMKLTFAFNYVKVRALTDEYLIYVVLWAAVFGVGGILLFFIHNIKSLFKRYTTINTIIRSLRLIFLTALCLVLLVISLSIIANVSDRTVEQTSIVFQNPYFRTAQQLTRTHMISNPYGLFRSMTGVGERGQVARPEIIIEGNAYDTDHDAEWIPFHFKYKPGDVNTPPPFVAPHQPRLDWQMWFAALSNYRNQDWFVHLLLKLLEGSDSVYELLDSERNHFSPTNPPKRIRSKLYHYDYTMTPFTLPEKHRDFGTRETSNSAWWRREYKGLYSPEVNQAVVKQSLQTLFKPSATHEVIFNNFLRTSRLYLSNITSFHVLVAWCAFGLVW